MIINCNQIEITKTNNITGNNRKISTIFWKKLDPNGAKNIIRN